MATSVWYLLTLQQNQPFYGYLGVILTNVTAEPAFLWLPRCDTY
jgi:hypothetical protein